MRRTIVAALLLAAASARAQDVLTIGSDHAPAGGTVQIPVYVRDVSGTTLGNDAGAGKLIGGYALKVFYPSSQIASISFVRAGVAAPPVPLFETTFAGAGYVSAVASFRETDPMTLTLNAVQPGNRIGTLNVTLQVSVAVGTVIPLTIHPASAMLSSQSGVDRETIAAGNLSLVNGSITVTSLATPANLVATPNGTSQVGVMWTAVGGTDHYDVQRSFNGGAFVPVGSPSGASFTDTGLSANLTYLYRVRAVNGTGELSGFSNTDAATTTMFTDASLAGAIVQAVHFLELRTAVNAMRTSASLPPLASDPTVAAGQIVRAQHLTSLRSGLDQARAAIGQPALTYTAPTVISAAHVTGLRAGAH